MGGTLGVLNVPQSDGEQRLGDIVCIWGTFWGSSLSPSPCSPAAMFSAVTPLPGRTLLGPPSAEPPTFARTGSDFADRSQPFRLGERSFSRQYAHLYATRLLCMRPRLEQQARLRWGEPPHPPSVPLTLIVTPQPVAAPHCSLFPEGIPPNVLSHCLVLWHAARLWDLLFFLEQRAAPQAHRAGVVAGEECSAQRAASCLQAIAFLALLVPFPTPTSPLSSHPSTKHSTPFHLWERHIARPHTSHPKTQQGCKALGGTPDTGTPFDGCFPSTEAG